MLRYKNYTHKTLQADDATQNESPLTQNLERKQVKYHNESDHRCKDHSPPKKDY